MLLKKSHNSLSKFSRNLHVTSLSNSSVKRNFTQNSIHTFSFKHPKERAWGGVGGGGTHIGSHRYYFSDFLGGKEVHI